VRNRSIQIAKLMEKDDRFREVDTYRGMTKVRARRVGVLGTLYVRKRDARDERTAIARP
jgi:hypothetical protein